MSLIEELIKNSVLDASQAIRAVRLAEDNHEGDLDSALQEMKIDEDKILEVKSKVFGMPVKKIDPKNIAPSVLKIIPIDAARNYQFVPLNEGDNFLEIGIVNPENVKAIDALTFITAKYNKPFKLFLIAPSVYKKLLEMYDGSYNPEVEQALSELDTEIANVADEGVVIERSRKESDKLKPGEEERIVEEAPIIKIVAVILRSAVENLASDIHIENTGTKVRVRFRVDGVLHTSLVLPISVYNGVIARIKILSKLRLDEKRKPQDGGFSARINNSKIDFRVSTMPSYYGEKIVMRILDAEKGLYLLDEMGISKHNLELIRKCITAPYGLILMTGPTGSGKTSTLYSMLSEISKEDQNIVSLEDPIEYKVEGVNQSQIAPEIGYTFATGLRSILRQDPNIILVGEIRDRETAELAIQAALTGHLVFSTLHTNSAIGAVPRLIDMGIDPYLIAPTLKLCMAQRLARTIHPNGKKEMPMDDSLKELIEHQFEDLPKGHKDKLGLKDTLYEAVPCEESATGLKGRTAVFEMFEVDKEMQEVILKKPQEQEIYKVARSKGMITLREDAILKSMNGDIPFQEIYNF